MQKFIEDLILKAGDEVLKRFEKIIPQNTKSDASDIVTEADLASEKVIIDGIKKHYPSHAILSEESGRDKTESEYLWIIDPLDGTNNFSRRAPLFGVMIGLAKEGRMIMSAIYDPCINIYFLQKRARVHF